MKRHHNAILSTMLCAAFLLPALGLSARGQTSGGAVDAFGNPADLTVNKKTSATKAKAPASYSDRFEKEGVAVEFSIEALAGEGGQPSGLVAGADALVTFRLSDARTGQPLTGVRPSAWLSARRTAAAPGEAECKDKVRAFVGGLLSTRPDIDLNGYVLVTFNHDNTITFINPQVSFNITKLESIVVLPGRGADWVLSKNKEHLYLTLPEQSSVAVINTATRKLAGTIPVGDGTRPRRLALDPEGRFLWVGLDDAPQVAVIDTATNKLKGRVAVGAGLHQLAFTRDGRRVYVTNSADNTVSAINAETLTKLADIRVGRTPVPVAYSTASNLIYVASLNDTFASAIDPATGRIVARIPTPRGIVALRFEPEGRYGFMVNQVESTLTVFDSATNGVIASAPVAKGPDQVAFTRGYAYVRSTGSEKFSLVELSQAKRGKFTPIEVQAGQAPTSADASDIGVSDMIAPTPEGNSVMVASAPDQMIYYYVEGLMAPMGTLKNYKRRPLGLMILDRSLTEKRAGVYSVPIKLRDAGIFDVPVVIDQPRIVKCFQLEVAPSPDASKLAASAQTSVEPLFRGQTFAPGKAVPLRFRITDAATRQPLKGLTDVLVMTFEPPGSWQQRQWAKEVGEGVYEVQQVFPNAVPYMVMVGIGSRRVRFSRATGTEVMVTP